MRINYGGLIMRTKVKSKNTIKKLIDKAHPQFLLKDIKKTVLDIPSESESRAIENGIKIYY